MANSQKDFIASDAQILTVGAAAKVLGIESKKISYYCRTKKDFPQGKMINRRRYFSLDELEKMKKLLKDM